MKKIMCLTLVGALSLAGTFVMLSSFKSSSEELLVRIKCSQCGQTYYSTDYHRCPGK